MITNVLQFLFLVLLQGEYVNYLNVIIKTKTCESLDFLVIFQLP